VTTICLLVKNYYDVDKIESIKAKIAKLPTFRFFISPQYTDEPKYDIYVVSDDPRKMLFRIHISPWYKDIEHIELKGI
jgi:hypothetical protein